MCEGILPHVCLYGGSHYMAGIGHVKACHSVYDAERKVYAADYDDGSYGQGCQIIHAYVGNITQYQRQYQFADRC